MLLKDTIQQQLQEYVDGAVEGNVVVHVQEGAMYDKLSGQGQIAGYKNNSIMVSLQGLQQTVDKLGVDIEDAAVISTTHELGHHLAGHEGPFYDITNVNLIQMEVEAWMNGRQLAVQLEQHFPGFLALYDQDNVNNLYNAIFTHNLFNREDAVSIWGDCMRAMKGIKAEM